MSSTYILEKNILIKKAALMKEKQKGKNQNNEEKKERGKGRGKAQKSWRGREGVREQ